MSERLRGRYETLEVVGRGGQGEVVKALDHLHNRVVAIKIRRSTPEHRDALLEEARTLLNLEPHRGLPIVRDDFFEDGRYYMVMDWIEGPNLQHVLEQRGDPGLPYSTVLAYLAPVAEALDHLHAQEPPVVHQDVKPANLILTGRGRVVLVDLGIASSGRAATGLGTRGYVAPELAAGERPIPAADIFSLAATAYALLTGGPPYGDRPAWQDVPESRLQIVERALGRALSMDPQRRPGSAGELLERLGTRLESQPATVTREHSATPVSSVAAPTRLRKGLISPTRRTLLVAGAVVAAVIVGVLLATLPWRTEPLGRVDANALGLISSETGEISAEVQVGGTPTRVAVGEGAVWVTNSDDNTASRIDPVKRTVVQTIAVGSSPSGITTGNSAVWVANSLDGTVSRVDPETNTVVQSIRVGNGPVGIVSAASSIWVANTGDDTVTRIDADSGTPTKTMAIAATELAFGAGTLWATERKANRVARIDPETGDVVRTIPVGNGPTGLAFGGGAAWVVNSLDGTVSRIDPSTDSVTATIATGDGPTAVAVGGDGVWVSNQFDGTLARIDPQSNQVVQRISVGNRPQGVAVLGGDVLVSVRQSGAGHQGGTLTVRMNRDLDSIDTAIAYDTASWPVLRMTNDGLVAFNQASGLAGTQIVPDLAVSLPSPTDGGTTYTFRLRANIRYSNGAPLKASDFRFAFERAFKLGKLPVPYYDGIVGAALCKKDPEDCDLSRGIVADDAENTVTFHLEGPDREFLYKLALPFAYVVPAGTPPQEVVADPLPGTGPYTIASYRPERDLRLVRNPQFHEWSKAAQPDGNPDEIIFEIGGSPDDAVNDVISGDADAFSTSQSENPPSEDLLTTIKTRYASQVHTNPQPATIALFLNTRLAPFDRLDVRRGLNYAADRTAAVEVAGGPDVAQLTCQILPPYFPGYRSYCPYTAGTPREGSWTEPDLAKARALVDASGTRGMKITVWSWEPLGGFGPYAVKLLRSLGYRASMKVVGGFKYFLRIGDSRTKAQIGTYEWISDYPAASGFIGPVLSCASFLPANPVNTNPAQFCDPRIDRQIAQALTNQAANPAAARGLWEQIDRLTVDQAPWVPLVNPKAIDVLSERVGNYQYSPQLGMLIDQLWVR